MATNEFPWDLAVWATLHTVGHIHVCMYVCVCSYIHTYFYWAATQPTSQRGICILLWVFFLAIPSLPSRHWQLDFQQVRQSPIFSFTFTWAPVR